MPFTDLTEHVQETFSRYTGTDDYEAQLDLWCWQTRARRAEGQRDRYDRVRAVARANEWRKANLDYFRAYRRQYQKAKEAQPGYWRTDKYKAQKARYRNKHREHVREVNRKNQAARRARLKEQQRRMAAMEAA